VIGFLVAHARRHLRPADRVLPSLAACA